MAATDDWQVFSRHLDQLSLEVSEYLRDAETPEDFRYRKGFLDGHIRTKNLLYTLISLGEEGDAEWMAKELEKALEPFRTLGLARGRDQREEEQAVSRLSRVMQRVREEREQQGSTEESSTQH